MVHHPPPLGGSEKDKEQQQASWPPPRVQWTTLDASNVGLRALSPPLFMHYSFLTTLALNNNHLTFLPPAIERMRNLMTLDLSHNDLKQVPAELGLLTRLRELRLQHNRLNMVPAELGNLYMLRELVMDANPWVEPYSSFKDVSLIPYLRDNRPMLPAPSERQWIASAAVPMDPASGFRNELLTVMTWNILADKMATPQQYGYCPQWALGWEYRKTLILKEITRHEPDIICLQEVEGQQFHAFFNVELRRFGYDSLYRPKARAKTMSSQEAQLVDGCAIFFKAKQFTLLEERPVEFSLLVTARPELTRSADMLNRVMPMDNIAIVAKLQHLATRRSFLVANVHLTWHPDMTDVRLIQTTMLCEEMRQLAAPKIPSAVGGNAGDAQQLYPVIVCGDFNALPGSGAHSLLLDGHLDASRHPELQDREYGAAYTTARISQPFRLASANIAVRGEEPDWTNHTPKFSGTLDYIFADTTAFDVAAVLSPVQADDIKWRVGFPDPHFPSDHVPQVARLRWKSQSGAMAGRQGDY